MELPYFEEKFNKIVASYSENAAEAIKYCSEDNGEAFNAMRVASEEAMHSIKNLLLQYLHGLN